MSALRLVSLMKRGRSIDEKSDGNLLRKAKGKKCYAEVGCFTREKNERKKEISNQRRRGKRERERDRVEIFSKKLINVREKLFNEIGHCQYGKLEN